MSNKSKSKKTDNVNLTWGSSILFRAMRPTSKRPMRSRVADFWKSFVNDINRMREQGLGPGAMHQNWNDIWLRIVHPLLVCQFRHSGDQMEFVVSADGACDAIPAVEALYAAAPVIEGWKITKYRQRWEHDRDGSITINGATLDAMDVEFAIDSNGDKAALMLFVPGLTGGPLRMVGGGNPTHEDATGFTSVPITFDEVPGLSLVHAAFLLCDSLVGEYALMTQVHAITYVPFETESPYLRQSLVTLPDVLEKFLTR